MAPPRKHPAPRTTRCRSFEDFALKVTAKKRKRGYRRALGIKRCRSKRTIRPRIDPRVSWPRIPDFMERFRLPPACVEELTREFERSRFRPGKGEEENRGSPIPLLHKVCYALRYMATGSDYAVVRDTQGGVARSTVGLAVAAFVKFLVSTYHKHVKFPKGEQLHEAAIRFADRHNVNQCVGIIDGTYVPIRRPVRNEHCYINRKQYQSLNVLLACDHEERITFVESGMSGSHHDQFVLDYSDLGYQINKENRLGDYFLLGDGGYSLTPHVFTPFRCHLVEDLEPWDQKYQKAITRARSSVERCIGQLKGRWRCLSKTGVGAIQMPPLEASWLVKACCVLHNRCIDWELRRMRPGKNKDPEHENKIQKLARRRFLAANQQLVDSDDDGDHDATQAREVTLDGILRRKLYIHKNYGGPRPEMPRVRHGRGRGRGPRGGVGQARGRGRGRGAPVNPSSTAPCSRTPRRGVKHGRVSGRGRSRATE